VEFEFLEVLKSLKSKRDVTVTYGSVLRAGNTSYDLGKRAIDPYGKSKKPVMVLEEHLVINKPQRLRELLQKHYPESAAKQSCLPEELTYCLQVNNTKTQRFSGLSVSAGARPSCSCCYWIT